MSLGGSGAPGAYSPGMMGARQQTPGGRFGHIARTFMKRRMRTSTCTVGSGSKSKNKEKERNEVRANIPMVALS